jgi:hypothetical protein
METIVMMPDYSDPYRTLAVLRELESMGFGDDAFSLLHHFKEPETIANHRRYCDMLLEEKATFRTNSNRLVQRRLEMVLAMYKAGGFVDVAPEVFAHLARAAVVGLPHDRRPLSEQVE